MGSIFNDSDQMRFGSCAFGYRTVNKIKFSTCSRPNETEKEGGLGREGDEYKEGKGAF